MSAPMTPSSKPLGILALVTISIAGVFSIRHLPAMAEYGLASVVYFVIAAILYFIPSALVCAELATGWPKTGGMYIWVKEGLGEKLGFLSIWFEWTNTIVSFPAVLSVIVTTLAYAIMPAMAENKLYTFIMMLVLFWGTTFINFLGIKISGWVSTLGVILGTILPISVMIVLAAVWYFSGNALQIHVTKQALTPHFAWGQIAYLAGLVLSYAGMQVAAFHAHDVKNPQRDYPRAILLAMIVIVAASILGTLAIAIIVPQQQISLVAGVMQTITAFLSAFHLSGLIPICALLVVLGAMAGMNTWLIGPSRGIWVAAEQGYLPKSFMRHNKRGVPVNVLLLQALVGSLLASIYLFMPNVNNSYWFLNVLTSQLTMLMYILLFLTAIRLRYTQPHVQRAYRVPGGKVGMIIIAGSGMLMSLFALIVGFIPPTQFSNGAPWHFALLQMVGILLFLIPGILLYRRSRSRANYCPTV